MRPIIKITRATRFDASEQCPIPLEEWLSVVGSDNQLRLSHLDEDRALVHWMAHRVGGECPWFIWWFDDDICVDLWDRKTLGKALQLAQMLKARVLGEDDREFHGTEDYRKGSLSPPIPPSLLDNLDWSFPDNAPTDRVGFEDFVWQSQYRTGNNRCWDPEETVLVSPHVRVSYLCWRGQEQVEPVLELVSDNGTSFTAGDLLYKIHQGVAESLRGADHRFLEGLILSSPVPAGQSPLYWMRLGS